MSPKEIATNNSQETIPSWITQEYFEDIVSKEIKDFSRITKFSIKSGSEAGENYASIMVRVLIEVELKDGSRKEFPIMMKTTHAADSLGGQMTQQMGVFAKENEIYDIIIPAFEKLYSDKGKSISIAPKSFKLSKDPGVDTVVLEDLNAKKFKLADRIKGLDMDHTKGALKKLAEFHAASAVHFEKEGEYSQKFIFGLFEPANKPMLMAMYTPLFAAIQDFCLCNIKNSEYYSKKMFNDINEIMEKGIKISSINPDEFNVLNHGDSWCNNFMFNYKEDGSLDETMLIDFQMCKYGPPTQDLLYFIFTSPQQSIRLEHFDYMIKYYHDNLVENLKLLGYQKKIPTLCELHITILKHSAWAKFITFGTFAMAKLEKTDNAKVENFFKTDEEGTQFKKNLFSNPNYLKCVEEILPWLDNRGMLD